MNVKEQQIRTALERLADYNRIPYLHVHMAFATFHTTMNNWIRWRHPRADPFRITRPEVVGITYLYAMLPEETRQNGNLTETLYALLTYYFSFWDCDFMSFTPRQIARRLKLPDRIEFEKAIVYLCTHFYKGLFGIAQRTEAYKRWEHYLFT